MRLEVRGLAIVALGVWAAACGPIGRKGGGPGGSNGPPVIQVPPGLPALADLEKARVAQADRLPFGELPQVNFCFLPPPVDPATVNVDRSLFVHDTATLTGADFSLKRTLAKIASDAVAKGATGVTAETLFRDLWDTQNTAAAAAAPGGAQCDDAGTTLNGFPNACRAAEGNQAKAANLDTEMANYQPIGIVNRIDLAAAGWKNCGEHRIIYGRQSGIQKATIIFEAVLPNPTPGCETGCRAVANYWYQLSTVADPVARAQALEKLYYTGIPGYEPVVRVDHYAASASGGYSGGSGQIRVNEFLQSPWMLKEFKLALDCSATPCRLEPVPIPVKVNPDGNLWTENTAGLANAFQQTNVLPQVSQLAVADINKFGYQVPLQYDAARSEEQTGGIQDNYPEAYTAVPGSPGGFRASLLTAAAAAGTPLTDRQIINRATALSCAGCHQPTTFGLTGPNTISPGVSWPGTLGFLHVAVTPTAGVNALSAALTTTFLPARAANLAAILSDKTCFCRFRRLPFDVSAFEKQAFSKPPTSPGDIRTAETTLKRSIDVELSRRQLPPLPDLDAPTPIEPLVLDEVKASGENLIKRSEALRKAVRALVTAEPPRQTVTGSFRIE
jgi:hypothetical protein